MLSMRTFPTFLFLTVFLVSVSVAQESWNDDVKYYGGPVVLTALEGYRTVSAPAIGAKVTGTTDGPARVTVAGLVENGGQRFYMTDVSFSEMVGGNGDPVWITAGGTEQLPALPRLLKRGAAEDPDSGEEVMIEAYEETVTLQPESRWPGAVAKSERFFPAALLAVGEDAAGRTTVDLQLFMNTDASTWGYPFSSSSYNEISSGKPGAQVRLYSRPGTINVRLLIEGPSPVLPLMQPGLVFLAGFAEGELVRLSLGGDAWTESAPISRLGAPVFKNDGKLAFGFGATDFTGAKAVTPIRVLPDRIAGADYTFYKLISEMGAPFDENSPPEFQNAWTLDIERDLTTTLLAPLYDGRGAPGMIELEGLSLDPAPAAAAPENISDEVFAAFRDFLPTKTDPMIFGEGWKSILEHKLGEIPAAQRVPETANEEL
jgi:hypothetical protein